MKQLEITPVATAETPALLDTPGASEMINTGVKYLHVRAVSPRFDLERFFTKDEKGEKECTKFLKSVKKLDNDPKKADVNFNLSVGKLISWNKKAKRRNVSPAKLKAIPALRPILKLSVNIQTVLR